MTHSITKDSNISKAIIEVRNCFPFDGYISEAKSSMYIDIVKTVLRYINPGDSLLDFGSGPCDKVAILKTLGIKCSAFDDLEDYWHKIDNNQDKILNFADKFCIDYYLGGMDQLAIEKNQFKMLMMNDVLEHLHSSPRDLLNDLLEMVMPGGYLYITVPNAVNIRKRAHVLFGKTNMPDYEVFYWYPGTWRGHVREYNKDDLKKLSKYLNLHIVELRGCDHMTWKVPLYVKPFYRFMTSIFTGWKDSWTLVARKPENWKPNKFINEEVINKFCYLRH